MREFMGACPIATPRSPSPKCATLACGLLIYCSDYKCSHLVIMSGDRWPDDMRLSDLSLVSSAKPAASAVPTCGWTSQLE